MSKLDRIGELVPHHAEESQWNVQVLAQTFRVSVSTVERRVKKQHGMSAKKWMATVKMTRAARLLDEQHFSIEQIALELGYAHQNTQHFSRDFKRFFGHPPSEHRTQSR